MIYTLFPNAISPNRISAFYLMSLFCPIMSRILEYHKILEYLKFSEVLCQNHGISRPPQFWIASSGKSAY